MNACHCGLSYRAFRSPFSGNPRGAIATPNASKARAWAEHVAHCETYAAPGAADFDPAALGTVPSDRTTALVLPELRACSYAEPDCDDWGGALSPFEVEWHWREREARRLLGADFARVTEAA